MKKESYRLNDYNLDKVAILFDFEVGKVNYSHKSVIDCINMDSGYDIYFYNTESDEENRICSLVNSSRFTNTKLLCFVENYLVPSHGFIWIILTKRH